MKITPRRLTAAALLSVAFAAAPRARAEFAVAQSSMSVASVQLSASPSRISRRGSSSLMAMVQSPLGVGLSGRLVTFSVISGHGLVSPSSSYTNAGQAGAAFSAPDKATGKAEVSMVRACCEGVCGDVSIVVAK